VPGPDEGVIDITTHHHVRPVTSADQLARKASDLNQGASVHVDRPPITERQGPRPVGLLVDHDRVGRRVRAQDEPYTTTHEPLDLLD